MDQMGDGVMTKEDNNKDNDGSEITKESQGLLDPIKLVNLIIKNKKSESSKGPEPEKLVNPIELVKYLNDVIVDNKDLVPTKYPVKLGKFIFHFLFVMGLLSGGAVIFGMIEDPVLPVANVTKHQGNITAELREKFNINMTTNQIDSLRNYLRQHSDNVKKLTHQNVSRDRMLIFQKWFYFVTTATTTIGYGDVTPQTQNGRLFYIFFSLLGIMLMMTLLKSCAKLLHGVNKFIYRSIKKYVCQNLDLVSESILSAISLSLIFILYLSALVWRQSVMENGRHYEKRSTVDLFYFWIVTLTTVGFGDMTYEIEVEKEHLIELIIYRVFGLVLLASVIEAIHDYLCQQRWRDELFDTQRRIENAIRGGLGLK